MAVKKVFVSWDIPEIGIKMMEDAGLLVEVWKGNKPLTQEELIAKLRGFNVCLSLSIDKLDGTFFQQCAHLDVVSQFSVGYDNIDLSAASKAGIPLGNAPGAMTEATADIAFGLMIAASRKFFFMHQQIINGAWKVNPPQAFLGQELRGKTIGIFGMGKIGTEMARLCHQAYGMEVIYHNRHPLDHPLSFDAKYVSFDDLMAESDVLSVHAALSHSTQGIFDIKAFSKMKSTSIFINTSRGGLVVEEDLVIALKEKMIWGAGLDVTNPEPMRANHPLLMMENVCILPHIGSATVEARAEMSRLAALNIIEFYKSGKVLHPISQ